MTTIKSVFTNEDDDTVKTKVVKSPVQFDATYTLTLLQNATIDGYSSGQQALSAWGAHDFKGSEQSDKHGLSWIIFKVNASRHVGFVRVALKGVHPETKDAFFTITLEKFNNLSAAYGVVESEYNVKADDIGTTIDRLVER